jgi:uncharacterized protein (DUF849 family)
MSEQPKVIITCAVTGSVHTPTMSEFLPITPEQIADEAVAAADAGAAIVHLHAREPATGRPTGNPEIYGQFLRRIRERSDVVLNITTGGSAPIEERIAAAIRFKPELASLNMGSLSPYGRHRLLKKYDNWKYDWEPRTFAAARSRTYSNTEEIIERIIREVGVHGTRFECEVYDVGQLYNLAYFVDEGLIELPLILQTIFGFTGGIGLDPENITHLHTIARKLFGAEYIWTMLAPGRHQFRLCALAAAMGGNVRVGLEDNLYLARGQLARSNAEQVKRMRQILELLSFEVASPAEARRMLALKGADAVAC